jgi:tRNA-dihydrouridine synthase B
MLYAKRVEKNPETIEHKLYKIEEERPISIQLIGSDSLAIKKSINYLESYKFDVLDINAGCPSRRAIRSKEGGYLMKDLEKLSEILKIAVNSSSKPVSLKIRTGYDKPVDIEKVSKIINDSGIDFLIIHARSVRSRYLSGTLDLITVKKLKEKLVIPVVGNGDITDSISAKDFIEYTNVDAFMIGRESMGNPKIFQQIHLYLTKNECTPLKHSRNLIKKYINLYESEIDVFLEGISYPNGNDDFKFIELKRNSIWLTKYIENSSVIRTRLSKTKNLNHLKLTLKEIFN